MSVFSGGSFVETANLAALPQNQSRTLVQLKENAANADDSIKRFEGRHFDETIITGNTVDIDMTNHQDVSSVEQQILLDDVKILDSALKSAATTYARSSTLRGAGFQVHDTFTLPTTLSELKAVKEKVNGIEASRMIARGANQSDDTVMQRLARNEHNVATVPVDEKFFIDSSVPAPESGPRSGVRVTSSQQRRLERTAQSRLQNINPMYSVQAQQLINEYDHTRRYYNDLGFARRIHMQFDDQDEEIRRNTYRRDYGILKDTGYSPLMLRQREGTGRSGEATRGYKGLIADERKYASIKSSLT